MCQGDKEDHQKELIQALSNSIGRSRANQIPLGNRYPHCSKYHKSIPENYRVDFIDRLLEVNYEQRLTSEQAIQSVVLKPIPPIETFKEFLATCSFE